LGCLARRLAKVLGKSRISYWVRVAGGNGLVELENSWKGRKYFGNWIDVYGFDTGLVSRNPKIIVIYTESMVRRLLSMDKKTTKAVKYTFLFGAGWRHCSKVYRFKTLTCCFYSFDLDLYSATKQAFKLLEADQALLLPRICYFDDILGATYGDHNENV